MLALARVRRVLTAWKLDGTTNNLAVVFFLRFPFPSTSSLSLSLSLSLSVCLALLFSFSFFFGTYFIISSLFLLSSLNESIQVHACGKYHESLCAFPSSVRSHHSSSSSYHMFQLFFSLTTSEVRLIQKMNAENICSLSIICTYVYTEWQNIKAGETFW